MCRRPSGRKGRLFIVGEYGANQTLCRKHCPKWNQCKKTIFPKKTKTNEVPTLPI